MAMRSGARVGVPTVPSSVRTRDDDRLPAGPPPDDATRDDAWRALCHASRDLPEPERVEWLRDMRSALGLTGRGVTGRKPGHCACGRLLPVVIDRGRRDEQCTACKAGA